MNKIKNKLFVDNFPDVIDDFMIKTGTRRESIFYSFYVFFMKISAGVAIAVTNIILEFEFLIFAAFSIKLIK